MQFKLNKIKIILTLLSFFVIYSTVWKYQRNIKQNVINEFQVPNIVHYVLFNKTTLDFITYLSILSVLKTQKPDAVQIHTDSKYLNGYYWRLINRMPTNTSIHLNHMEIPTHIYGQPLSSIYHASDVTRIYILKLHGGIYLDNDVLVLNNLDDFRRYSMVLGCPDNESIGTQVLIAKKNAKFLELWLKGYQKYHPREWYYNAGKYPLNLIKHFPNMVHCEKEVFGVHNLIDKLYKNNTNKWNDWKKYYTIHLLYRHEVSVQRINETTVQNLNTTFGDIVKWILNM